MEWEGIKKAYEVVKNEIANRVDGKNFKVYSLGQHSKTIRIDIKSEQ